MLGRSPIKWRQYPNMTIAVDWDVKHQFKQKQNKSQCKLILYAYCHELQYSIIINTIIMFWYNILTT